VAVFSPSGARDLANEPHFEIDHLAESRVLFRMLGSQRRHGRDDGAVCGVDQPVVCNTAGDEVPRSAFAGGQVGAASAAASAAGTASAAAATSASLAWTRASSTVAGVAAVAVAPTASSTAETATGADQLYAVAPVGGR
jgi:hypothetical protein